MVFLERTVSAKFFFSILYVSIVYVQFFLHVAVVGMKSDLVAIGTSIVPVIHYVIMTKIYDGFVYRIPEKRRNFIYLLPLLYPLLFKIMHYSNESPFFQSIDEIGRNDVKYFVWIFGLNILLMSIVLITSLRKPETPIMAKPDIVDDKDTVRNDIQFVSELHKNDFFKQYTLKQEILFYVVFLVLYFSIAIPFIIHNSKS